MPFAVVEVAKVEPAAHPAMQVLGTDWGGYKKYLESIDEE